MKILIKILVSIPSIVGMANYITLLYPESLPLVTAYMDLQTWDISVNLLILAQVCFVLWVVWKSDFIIKKEKVKWTWLTIFLNAFSCFWFIWMEYPKFKKRNIEN